MTGLPSQKENQYAGYPDIHMNTAKGMTLGLPDIHMATTKGSASDNDIRMETARPGTTVRQNGFKIWEKELLESPEVKRKATVAQLCESSAPHVQHIPCLFSA